MCSLVLKLDEGVENFKLLQVLIRHLTLDKIKFQILSRPNHSYELDSMSGILEIHTDDDLFLDWMQEIISLHEASGKILWMDEDYNPLSLTYKEGVHIETHFEERTFSSGREVYYYGPMFNVHFGENPKFLESVEYEFFDALVDKYPFLNVDYEDHVLYCEGWFCIPRGLEDAFVYDINSMCIYLSQFGIGFPKDIVGIDAEFQIKHIHFLDFSKYDLSKIRSSAVI